MTVSAWTEVVMKRAVRMDKNFILKYLGNTNRVIFYPEKIFEFWGIGEVMDFEGGGGCWRTASDCRQGVP